MGECSTHEGVGMNGFDDFDTKVTAEEVYRDESLMGGKYHGPTNVAGLTHREYWEARWEWEDEQARLRDEW